MEAAGGPRPRRALVPALYAGAFLVYAAANAPVPIAAELRRGLGMEPGGAAVFLLPFAAGFGVGCLAWLLAARRASPRLLLPLALAGGAAASALIVATDDPAVAVASRVALGLAAAGYPAVAQAVITRTTDPARRGRAVGGFIAAVVAGSFLGQALVGALADIASPGTALLLVCVGAPVAVAAVLARLAPRRGATAPAATAAPPAGASARRLAPVLAVAALTFGAYWLLLSELPAVLRGDRFALGASEAGLVPALGVLGIASALLVGRWSDRAGRLLPARLCLVSGVAGLAVTLPDTPLWLFAAGYGLLLTAYWGYLPVASAEVAARSTAADRQAALIAFYAAMWTGAALAPAASAAMGWTGCALLAAGAWLVAVVPAARFGGRPAAPRRAVVPAQAATGSSPPG